MTVAVRNLRQTVNIRASPRAVYEALVNAREHARFTGAPARLVARVGGRFSHYGKDLEGVVIRLERNRRITLAWRSSDWPKGHHSIADFVIEKVRGGSRLVFSQFGIPSAKFRDIAEGWKDFYWTPLKSYLEST
ncbi:MAG: SRPBCC domain-containing protein [Thermoplasmata archaeon]|nr:SRPBCC domain-containing protein [Thermoplasmata archaeon]